MTTSSYIPHVHHRIFIIHFIPFTCPLQNQNHHVHVKWYGSPDGSLLGSVMLSWTDQCPVASWVSLGKVFSVIQLHPCLLFCWIIKKLRWLNWVSKASWSRVSLLKGVGEGSLVWDWGLDRRGKLDHMRGQETCWGGVRGLVSCRWG